jgi:hypothetical protein
MIRADWQKRRLENVEAELYHTVLSESSGNSLAAALLSESPAAKLLARVQRQIAAFERTWHRANTEFRRVRAEKAEPACPPDAPSAPGELASLPRWDRPPACPSAHTGAEDDDRPDGSPA